MRAAADHLAQLTILLPALTAVLALWAGHASRRATYVVSVLGGLLTLAVAAWLLVHTTRHGTVTEATIGPLPVGDQLRIPLRLQVPGWAAIVAVAVALVSLVVQTFARWYLDMDPRYQRFAATVALFTAAMLLVVLSGDVLLTLAGWELMGWCSYLLIGHESERQKARRAAQKAFLVTRVADAPFTIALVGLAVHARTTSIEAIVGLPPASVTALLILLVVGVAGKSAQVPFQDWLPDAMEGPTPASALIHAATMVAAGTVVLTQLHPLVAGCRPALLTLAILAAISVVLASVLALLQHDLKRLLAWSTIAQVGIMLLAIVVQPATDTSQLGIMQLLGHAMFKALLFLMIGWAAVLAGGTIVERISGIAWRRTELRRRLGIGLLALAGVPPLVGFVSKDLIVDESARQLAATRGLAPTIALVALVIAVPLTAAYCARAWLVLTHPTAVERHRYYDLIEDSETVQDVGLIELLETTPPVGETQEADLEPATPYDEEAADLTDAGRFGLWVLAVLSVVGGVVFFAPALGHLELSGISPMLIAGGLVAIAAAGLLMRALSVHTVWGDPMSRVPAWLRGTASRGLDVDRAYTALVATPVLRLSDAVRRLEALLDRAVGSLAGFAAWLGDRSERLHDRSPSRAIAGIAIGVLVVCFLGVGLW